MKKVGAFEKVSEDQFFKDMIPAIMEFGCEYTDENGETRNLTPGDSKLTKGVGVMYRDLKLPVRATRGSAGYDFFAPFGFELAPGDTIRFPTGVRVKIDEGWWLMALPRSGLGFKYRIRLDNTAGVIDSDYYGSDNEGHVFAKLTNEGDKTIQVNAGEAFMQGIFLPYGITYDDDATGIRNGGFGSTG